MVRPKVMRFDNTRPDFMPYGFTCELWCPTPMPRPDRHNEIEVNFLQSALTYLLGGRPVTVEAGHLVLFWGAIPHQIIQWETTNPYYVMTLPLAWFLSGGFPDHLVHPILAGEVVTDPVSSADDAARFRQWSFDFRSSRPLRERVAQLEIQARIMRLAMRISGRRAGRKATAARAVNPSSLSRADQIACYIARHYAEPLSADRIAKEVGLHTNYAMSLFRKAFGTTMVDFLVQHRLSHARRLLVTTADPVIEIAAAAGFGSLSRFNEAFKRACGCAPRDFRKAHQRPPRQP